jgi:hypothetical protein
MLTHCWQFSAPLHAGTGVEGGQPPSRLVPPRRSEKRNVRRTPCGPDVES